MPTAVPVPTKNPGDVLTSALWNSYLRDNINKLLNSGHRVLTVAQFAALVSPEGTKGTVAPDEVYLEVDSTNGIQWHVAYESSETTYKWRYIGGPPMLALVATAETSASGTYVDLATVGPSVVVPRGGDYDAQHAGWLANSTVSGTSFQSPKPGSGAAADQNAIGADIERGTASYAMGLGPVRMTALSASDTVKVQYRVGGGTGTFSNRRLAVTPVRII